MAERRGIKSPAADCVCDVRPCCVGTLRIGVCGRVCGGLVAAREAGTTVFVVESFVYRMFLYASV